MVACFADAFSAVVCPPEREDRSLNQTGCPPRLTWSDSTAFLPRMASLVAFSFTSEIGDSSFDFGLESPVLLLSGVALGVLPAVFPPEAPLRGELASDVPPREGPSPEEVFSGFPSPEGFLFVDLLLPAPAFGELLFDGFEVEEELLSVLLLEELLPAELLPGDRSVDVSPRPLESEPVVLDDPPPPGACPCPPF